LLFDGYGIGGLLRNGRQELKELLKWMVPLFDTEGRKSKPPHLLEIADKESIRNAGTKGIDPLDSAYPTRLGRFGRLLSHNGHVRIKSGKYRSSFSIKINDKCTCSTCQHYDRAYLWHLFKANEPIAVPLATVYNIQYMNDTMALKDRIS
jgi:queuine tRNA-ribosyltransferase